MNQTERMYEYLKHNGSIDPLQAWHQLGIYRLGARIFDLRESGVKIESGVKKVTNQFGENCHVALYTLDQNNA